MSWQNCKIKAVRVDSEKYHAHNEDRGTSGYVVSPSMLKVFGECASRWRDGYVSPESEAKDYGSLLDCMALTPELFESRYAVRPDTYPDTKTGEPKPWNGNSNWCRAWLEKVESEGRKPLKQTDLAEVQAAVKRLRRDEILSAFSDASEKQVHVIGEWADEDTGLVIPCQCLIDYAPRKDSEFAACLGDLKTTRSALPFAWRRWSSQRGYHLQGALDIDIFNAATGESRETWCFVVQENFSPWQTARYMLASEKLNFGRVMYESLLRRYARCLQTGEWPDYNDNAAPFLTVQGWTIDEADRWDEAAAMNTIPEIVDPPEPPSDERQEDDLP